MKQTFIFVLSYLFAVVAMAQAEDLGVFKIGGRETKAFTYKSPVGQVFEFQVIQGPELPPGQRGFEFGWKKQSVFCEGKNCSQAGGFLLFCPTAGVITGDMKNLSDSDFMVNVQRVECEGKDAGSVRCPLRASTVTAMCGS